MNLTPQFPFKAMLALVVLGGAAFFLFKRSGGALVQDAAAGAVGAVADAGAGVAVGIGDAVGIPRTDLDACELAIKEGRTWDASFACPAKRFVEYVATGK